MKCCYLTGLLCNTCGPVVILTMPITFFSKLCPGAPRCGRCTWSTEVQGEPAFISEHKLLCQVCTVIQGLHCNHSMLQLHLANLYMLDTDQFRKAHGAIGDVIFQQVAASIKAILSSKIPTLQRAREDERNACLARSVRLLTDGSWTLQCWTSRCAGDNRDLCECEVSFGHLPVHIRSHIYEFICCDVWKLYTYLCSIKRRGYNVLSYPIFWHIPNELQEISVFNAGATRSKMIGIYAYIITNLHKPMLQSLKNHLMKYDCFLERMPMMYKHRCILERVIDILNLMLFRDPSVIGDTVF